MRRALAVLLVMATICAVPRPASAYLKLGFEVRGRQVLISWRTLPVRYYVTNIAVPGVSVADFQAALGRAFTTWQNVPTASITYQFAAVTNSRPGEDDGRSTLGFLSEPSLDRVLASTSFLVDTTTGELLESDIFFNSTFPWSVSGDRSRWDVESIAVHEIGHMSGLGHSALGETEVAQGGRTVRAAEAVMFPIALGTGDTSGRTLKADDVAGISDLYPDGGFNADTGSVSGRITKNSGGVFGAHILAFDISSGDMVANFSLDDDGQFSIAGLTPGPHVLRVEPLDDADIDSFFDPDQPVDLNFRTKYFEQLVVVPRGGDAGAVEIKVVPK